MIELSDLTFQYKKDDFHLNIKSLNIDNGESVAFIGSSGCGKTTLLSLIAGILPPQSGTIKVNNTRVSELSESERRLFRIKNVGFVFQDFALIDYLSVSENILHPYRINPLLKLNKEVKTHAAQLAEDLGLKSKLKSSIKNISQGEQQRVAICRALLNKPSVILADEPTANLDPENKGWVLDVLNNYVQNSDATLVVATHDHALLDTFDKTLDFRKI